MKRLLVVEDDAGIAFGLKMDFEAEGFTVRVESDGVSALECARGGTFDLILLDVMLPRKDGFEICRELRRDGVRTPIILLTAKTQEAEKIMGLEWGADDYITKPFSPGELRARARAVLRRTGGEDGGVFRFGDVEVDLDRCELRRLGVPVEVTALEFKVLTTFIQNRGRTLSRERLLDLVWGREAAVTDRVVDNHIMALRRKLEPEPGAPRYLLSIRGLGYRFDV